MATTVVPITPIPFQFEGLTLSETCWIDGKPRYTRRAIGKFLEMTRPQEGVDRIIQRNPYVRQFATHVKLTCVEGGRFVTREQVEVYDPIGLQLICMESRQPKAIQYKIAVTHLVWAYVNGQLIPSKWATRGARLAALNQIGSLPGGRAGCPSTAGRRSGSPPACDRRCTPTAWETHTSRRPQQT